MATNILLPWISSAGAGGVRHSMQAFEGDGSTGPFEFNFSGGYIYAAHVKAYRYDPGTNTSHPLAITLIGPNQAQSSEPIPTGQYIVLYRDTPKGTPLVDYTEGAVLDEANLDTTAQQAVFAAAEMVDRFDTVNLSVNEAIDRSALALSTASTALGTANTAAADAAHAVATADAASAAATGAVNTANQAAATANGVADKAQTALDNSIEAINTANAATAEGVAAVAQDALAQANAAVTASNGAAAEAAQAQADAATALAAANNAGDAVAQVAAGKADAVHTHPWNAITGKPAVATRWPTWSEVTDKPASFGPQIVTLATLPATDIGPVIVADVAEVWVWVSTPYYTGYRSPLCGRPVHGHTSVSLAGEIDAVGGVVSKSAYAGLWGYALENNLVVSQYGWENNIGAHFFVDVSDSQFRVPDLRNQFLRFAGTDADTGNVRYRGTQQQDALQNITGHIDSRPSYGHLGPIIGSAGVFDTTQSGHSGVSNVGLESSSESAWITTFDAARVARVATETRPTNVAFYPRIHV